MVNIWRPCATQNSTKLRPGRQVHEVVLVDLRGHQDQRDGADGVGRRRVLQQLAHLVAEDDGAGGDRQVAADPEGRRVDVAGEAVIRHDVAPHVAEPRDHALAAGLEGALDDGGIEEREVGRRQGRGDDGGRQLGPLVGAPVEVGVVDQLQGRAGAGQIALAQAVEGRVLLPGPVLEAPVPRFGGDRRAADGHLGHLDAEADHPAGERAGRRPGADLHQGTGKTERIHPS